MKEESWDQWAKKKMQFTHHTNYTAEKKGSYLNEENSFRN